MTVTVLKLSDADAYLKNISIRSIKDVRALDVDLMLVLVNGDRIIISSGAVSAMSAPESSLQFADGQLPLASVFQQIDKIDVSPEANLTVSSKEITRYNQNNARNKKARKNDEEDSDKPVVVEDGERDPSAAAETSGSSGNTERPNFSPTRSPDNQSQIADAEINSQHEKNWGVQWPIAAGALALLAAAGGGGGGGGSGGGNGGSAANGGSGGAGSGAGAAAAGSAGAGTVDPSAAVIRGNAALGAIKNANVTAYDAAGNAISDTVAVVDGKYTLTLTSESKGQTTSVQNLTLGYYWVAQKLENAKGGPGDDEILVGTTKDRQATVIETGSGRDTVTVGKFGTAATNLEATISDFQLEMDKVKVFLRDGGHKMNYQNITSANWQQFAPRAEQSAFGSGTKLVIDLDGAGAGTDKYTLYLPTVAFNYDTNTKSLFGL